MNKKIYLATLILGWSCLTTNASAQESLEKVFADLEERSKDCRFNDCIHESEPDCAVNEDVLLGVLDERKLIRYRALLKELSDQQAKISKRKNK